MADLPVTVPQGLHDDISQILGEPFAISYLCGAFVDRGLLFPRTHYAREKLRSDVHAMLVLEKHKLHLGSAQATNQRIEIPAIRASVERYERTGKF